MKNKEMQWKHYWVLYTHTHTIFILSNLQVDSTESIVNVIYVQQQKIIYLNIHFSFYLNSVGHISNFLLHLTKIKFLSLKLHLNSIKMYEISAILFFENYILN